MTARDFGMWALLALIWGSSFLAIGVGVQSFDPLTLVTGRMIIGAVVLTFVVLLTGRNLRLGRRGWIIAAIVGSTANIIPFMLISYAEQTVHSGVAALIMGIAPIATLSLAPFVHPDEVLTRTKLAGGFTGLFGVALLVGPEAMHGFRGDLLPLLALVLAALLYAGTALFTRRFPHPDALQMAGASLLVGACVSTTLSLIMWDGEAFREVSTASLLAMIYLGLAATALAAILYFTLIPRIGAARLQQVNYIVPIVGLVLGMVFLGERPSWNAWFAVPLILTGVWFVTRRDTPESSENTRKTNIFSK